MAAILDALLAMGFTATQDGADPATASEYSKRVTVHSANRPSWAAVAAKLDELAPNYAIGRFRRAIQAHIDVTAQGRSYDSGVTCSSYVGSTNPAWAAEATAFVAWRDAVWAYAYVELAKVQAGQRPEPTIPVLIGELPAIVWPA